MDLPKRHFSPKNFQDRLLVLDVNAYLPEYFDGFEAKPTDPKIDGVMVTVTVLDGEDPGEVTKVSQVTSGRLVADLRDSVQGQVVGRLRKNKAWFLERPTPEERKLALEYKKATEDIPLWEPYVENVE